MTIKRYQPIASIRLIFAAVLALLSLYLFYSGTLFGLILLGAAIKLGLREGVEVDLQYNRYRKIYGLFGLDIGSWKKLPEIEYVSVFKTKKKSRSRVIAAEANLDFVVYKVNLFYERNKHIEAYVADEKDDAFKVANDIATSLEVEIHDAT